MARKYQRTTELLPQIQEIPTKGMPQKQVEQLQFKKQYQSAYRHLL